MKSLTPTTGAVWTPAPESIAGTNIGWLMRHAGVSSYEALHAWSVQHRESYWAAVIERLGIRCRVPYDRVVDLSGGMESPRWLPGASLNIVESCFTAPVDSPAIIAQAAGGELAVVTVGELKSLSDRVVLGLTRHGFRPGDALAVVMPMTVECVAIYLGILQAGCVAVSIADSFRPREIATRLRLADAVGVFTQDVLRRGGKTHPLYAGVKEAEAPPAIVIPQETTPALRDRDCEWGDFLAEEGSSPVVLRDPSDPLNILFSSGTTGEPKVIPWTQTTPIKCAADAHFHQDVRPGDVVVWPTNIGWMMGPWLIFASLINRATMGLYDGAPTGREFCRFVQDSRATMLGVVPSLVKAWRAERATEGLDWSEIRAFSSTGECSDARDMRWLMEQGGGKPVIEYCGGTEIGGGYIAGTLAMPCVAGAFNTPALGLDFVILDEAGDPAETGELFLVPPSIGMSTRLLNKDHHEAYFAGVPRGPRGEVLRRHGDQMEALPGGGWHALGRSDDTMNLGGIKVSSAEIERALQSVEGVTETAAVAVSPGGGPSLLVIYAVCANGSPTNKNSLMAAMQSAIRRELNPLFRIHDVVLVESLPRTASNKVMRRILRDQYLPPSPVLP
ncbi:AMP-binding protein (plasmid) [Tundrisphaera lichenicola]|uniref:AMP-binding protein n=1 Tax=Tundrisphaera lichenicola TaxID=2029860 RepID=UPI003EBF0C33